MAPLKSFEDLTTLEDRDIQIILRKVETEELSMALNGASPQVKQKIFTNLSDRVAGIIQDQMKAKSDQQEEEIKRAQKHITDLAD